MDPWSGDYVDCSIPWPTSPDVRIFDLALQLEPGMPRHPHHPPFAFALAKSHGESNYPNGVSTAMETFSMGAHLGSHVDALGHVSLNGEGYGGVPMAEHQTPTQGLDALSTLDVPPLIGPGHLLDAEKLLGRQLTPADGIGPPRARGVIRRQAEHGTRIHLPGADRLAAALAGQRGPTSP